MEILPQDYKRIDSTLVGICITLFSYTIFTIYNLRIKTIYLKGSCSTIQCNLDNLHNNHICYQVYSYPKTTSVLLIHVVGWIYEWLQAYWITISQSRGGNVNYYMQGWVDTVLSKAADITKNQHILLGRHVITNR